MKWIIVTNELPENDGRILCLIPDHSPSVQICTFVKPDNFYYRSIGWNVTKWMPLPTDDSE